MKRTIAALLLSLAIFPALAADLPTATPEQASMSSTRLARLDRMVEEQMEKQLIPGAVVLVARAGKVVYHKAYGYADADKRIPMQKDSIFRIASQTKAITSVAVMMLMEEGRFLLDDPVSMYLPEFAKPTVLVNYDAATKSYTTRPAKGEITIRQLLTHTSGIDYSGIGSNDDFKAIYANAGVPLGWGEQGPLLAQKMKILAKLPLKHDPGERFTYGLNTDVLGYLVEVLSGMTLDEFFRKRIFEPLAMDDTAFYLPPAKQSRLVGLHWRQDGKIRRFNGAPFGQSMADYPLMQGTYFSGGAGLSGAVMDYARFLQMLLNKGELDGVRLLSRKTIELMTTSQTPMLERQFGLGFDVENEKNDYKSIATIGSFGWGGAFRTEYWVDPKEKLVGLIYTNTYMTDMEGRLGKFRNLVYQAIVD